MNRCPRCGSASLLDYGEVVECVPCHLTLRKRAMDELDEDALLAEEEKKSFVDTLLDEDL